MEHNNWTHFVGVDWASAEHEVCALDAAGQQVEARAFKNSGDGLTDLCAWLPKFGEPGSIAIAIELPHRSVVEALLDSGFTVCAINPKQLDRFRDRLTLAGAKDDRRDAFVLASSLRTDNHLFRRLAIQPATIIELREWSRIHDELQAERNALVNQMRAQREIQTHKRRSPSGRLFKLLKGPSLSALEVSAQDRGVPGADRAQAQPRGSATRASTTCWRAGDQL
jgi:hypothetical protein